MSKTIPPLGQFALSVLQQVWNLQPCTERQVWDALCQERELARTSVLKTLQRLEAKGLLVRVAGASPVQYRAVVPAERFLPALVDRFVNSALGGLHSPLVSYLAGSNKLSAKDLAALRTIARKLDNAETD